MESCVIETPGSLGGSVKVAERELFEVLVAGTGL